MNFEIELTWGVEDDVLVDLIVTGTKRAAVPAKLSGHPDAWAPEDGGELEDLRIMNARRCELPRAVTEPLTRDRFFLRAVDKEIEEAARGAHN